MKCHWLALSCLGVVVLSEPASASKLTSWRFEPSKNQLVFTTEKSIQPKAKLISDPTRLVIDLPGVKLDKPTVNQSIKGTIDNIRVGQLDEKTTRIVVELASGYTIDPEKIEISGLSPTQWQVNIPTPEKIKSSDNLPSKTKPQEDEKDFQVTKNGLFIRLANTEGRKIVVRRSSDRQTVDVELIGVTLPESLISRSLPVDEYGVKNIEFVQSSDSPAVARIKMTVTEDSSDWGASFSRFGGLVLWQTRSRASVPPENISTRNTTNSTNTTASAQERGTTKKATIKTVELNNTQLVIRSDQEIKGQGNFNHNTGVYEIRISNAQLQSGLKNPQLDKNSLLSRLRIRQEDPNTVLILVMPNVGVSIEELNQISDNTLALQIREVKPISRSITNQVLPPDDLDIQPVASQTALERAWQRLSPSRPNNEKLLVVIDPGHGGRDPGAIGIRGLKEVDVILPISQQVAEILEKQGIQIMMTRKEDYFVSLQDRAEMANEAGASLFVSIHANSMGMSRPDVNGIETYYFDSGRALADTIHKNILRRVNIDNRGVRRARFYVLRKTTMPAVLVEVGFVTGAEDAPKLSNPAFRRQMAEAIANGIIEYIKRNKL